jgi:hypothetical protein
MGAVTLGLIGSAPPYRTSDLCQKGGDPVLQSRGPRRSGNDRERAEFGDTRRQYIARIQLMTKTQTAVVHRLVWAPLHSNEHTHFPDCEAQDVQGDSISDIGIVGVESTFRPAVKNFEQLGL